MPIIKRGWSGTEKEFIRNHYPRLKLDEIARVLGRSVNAINAQRFRMGIPSQPRHRNFRHGYSSGANNGRANHLYKVWDSMIQRCTNPRSKGYINYGSRGITVCERWRQFENFLKDMGPVPKGYSLERLDNNAGYSPENCKWATAAEQANNRRSNKILRFKGETLTVRQWGTRFHLPRDRINQRLRAGWTVSDALTTPVGGRR